MVEGPGHRQQAQPPLQPHAPQQLQSRYAPSQAPPHVAQLQRCSVFPAALLSSAASPPCCFPLPRPPPPPSASPSHHDGCYAPLSSSEYCSAVLQAAAASLLMGQAYSAAGQPVLAGFMTPGLHLGPAAGMVGGCWTAAGDALSRAAAASSRPPLPAASLSPPLHSPPPPPLAAGRKRSSLSSRAAPFTFRTEAGAVAPSASPASVSLPSSRSDPPSHPPSSASTAAQPCPTAAVTCVEQLQPRAAAVSSRQRQQTAAGGQAVRRLFSSPIRKFSSLTVAEANILLQAKQEKAARLREESASRQQEKLRQAAARSEQVEQRVMARLVQKQEAVECRLSAAAQHHDARLELKRRKAETENLKVAEIAFINALTEQMSDDRMAVLQQRLHRTEERRKARQAERLQSASQQAEKHRQIQERRRAQQAEADKEAVIARIQHKLAEAQQRRQSSRRAAALASASASASASSSSSRAATAQAVQQQQLEESFSAIEMPRESPCLRRGGVDGSSEDEPEAEVAVGAAGFSLRRRLLRLSALRQARPSSSPAPTTDGRDALGLPDTQSLHRRSQPSLPASFTLEQLQRVDDGLLLPAAVAASPPVAASVCSRCQLILPSADYAAVRDADACAEVGVVPSVPVESVSWWSVGRRFVLAASRSSRRNAKKRTARLKLQLIASSLQLRGQRDAQGGDGEEKDEAMPQPATEAMLPLVSAVVGELTTAMCQAVSPSPLCLPEQLLAAFDVLTAALSPPPLAPCVAAGEADGGFLFAFIAASGLLRRCAQLILCLLPAVMASQQQCDTRPQRQQGSARRTSRRRAAQRSRPPEASAGLARSGPCSRAVDSAAAVLRLLRRVVGLLPTAPSLAEDVGDAAAVAVVLLAAQLTDALTDCRVRLLGDCLETILELAAASPPTFARCLAQHPCQLHRILAARHADIDAALARLAIAASDNGVQSSAHHACCCTH